MRYREFNDPFFHKQPKTDFAKELCEPMHCKMPLKWNNRETDKGEVFVGNAFISEGFPDSESKLKTVYDDFKLFLSICKAEGNEFCFKTVKNSLLEQESFVVTVEEFSCVIESADTEGIRRALYFLEDEMKRREGNFLPIGRICKKAVIKTRISRSVFAPNYNTGDIGELGDERDFYPDNYLNRLAYDGVNAIWVQEHFRTILPSEIIKEYGKNAEKRLKKLNDLTERAARYGIDVFLEGVEPASSFKNPVLKNYPELLGQKFCGTEYAFCTSTELGKAYIKEATAKLFELVPKLKGIVNISLGESVSSCAAIEQEGYTCPNCINAGFSRAEVLANSERLLLEGMRAVKKDAQLISWAYALRGWEKAEIEEYFKIRDKRVISMINFEDQGEILQLDKPKTANDYWLSYPGPGKLFEKATVAAKKKEAPIFAKIQVCSSHEVSSVPYVPVPGILYDKYKFMHESGVEGAMYCWYFGNYPSVMSKAAGELAFSPFFETKEEFLRYLAGIYWGKKAEEAAESYLLFEEGYKNYPLNTSFEWHGPMTDAPVWPLHLEPVDLPISRAYQLDDMPGCDRVGETILLGHSYDDTLALCNEMSKKWHIGTELILKIDDENEQKDVAKALDILFASGTNILKFYKLRNLLGMLLSDAEATLLKMREIVLDEIKNSEDLLDLCKKDSRLGYHAEAVGYKFFPEKLRWRIDSLKNLLETEFKIVEKRILNKEIPLPFYFGMHKEAHRYETKSAKWENFKFEDGKIDEKTKIRILESEKEFLLQIETGKNEEIEIWPEFLMFHPYAVMRLSYKNGLKMFKMFGLYEGQIPEETAKWGISKESKKDMVLWTITLKKEYFFENKDVPFRLAITKYGEKESYWEQGDRFFSRLILGNYSPDSFVFIIPQSP